MEPSNLQDSKSEKEQPIVQMPEKAEDLPVEPKSANEERKECDEFNCTTFRMMDEWFNVGLKGCMKDMLHYKRLWVEANARVTSLVSTVDSLQESLSKADARNASQGSTIESLQQSLLSEKKQLKHAEFCRKIAYEYGGRLSIQLCEQREKHRDELQVLNGRINELEERVAVQGEELEKLREVRDLTLQVKQVLNDADIKPSEQDADHESTLESSGAATEDGDDNCDETIEDDEAED